jgi:hypothetical protein
MCARETDRGKEGKREKERQREKEREGGRETDRETGRERLHANTFTENRRMNASMHTGPSKEARQRRETD